MDLVAGVDVDGSIAGTATAGIRGSTDVFAGLEFTPAGGAQPLATITTGLDPISPEFELSGEAGLRVFIRPEVTVLLYGVAGPYLNASPYGELGGSFDLCGYQAELNAGLTSDVGLQVAILDWRLVDIGPLRVLDWRTDPPLWQLGDSLPTLTVSVTPAGAGSVSISPDKLCYAQGEGVTLTAQAAPGFTFQSWSGIDSAAGTVAQVTMNDSRSVTARFSATPPGNQPPVAENQSVSVARETPTQITLRANDPDGGPSPLTFSIVANPAHGSLSPVNGNHVTYTPDAGYSGPDSFTFRVYDGEDYSNVATVSITVGSPGNQPPVAEDQSVSVPYETATPITLGAHDPDNGPQNLTYGIVSYPSHGTLSGTAPNVTYTPDAGYSGPDSSTFRAYDGADHSNVATVSITVGTGPNQPPIAQDQAVSVPFETPTAITLVANDPDNGPDELSFSIVSDPNHGTLSGMPPNVTYSPDAGYSGPDSFTFQAYEGAAYGNIATVSITVEASGMPVAQDVLLGVPYETAVDITLPATDPDNGPGPLQRIIQSLPQHGTLEDPLGGVITTVPYTLLGNHDVVTYTPDTGLSGADTFTFTAHDGLNESNEATVTLVVPNPGNEAEPNDSREQANQLPPFAGGIITAVRGDLADGADDYDYFWFTANAGDRISATLDRDVGDLGACVYLLDEDGTLIYSCAGTYPIGWSDYVVNFAGTYYILVSRHYGCGSYTLTVTKQ